MAAIYSNENHPLGIVEHLRALGHDVPSARDAGNPGQGIPDEEVLAFATACGKMLITHNRKHFFRLHAVTAGQHAGIIACTFDPDEARQARLVHHAFEELQGHFAGRLVRIYRPVKGEPHSRA